MRRCIFVVGTRAQLVKLAPVIQRISRTDLPYSIWFAGQHSDSMRELLNDFELPRSAIDGEMKERSSVFGLAHWLPRAIYRCYSYVRQVRVESNSRPLTVVHGDTLSTLVGATASRLAGADVVHLESGLSSGSLLDPFPEEVTRRMVFRLTRFALCPNTDAASRMRQYPGCDVVDTGENTLLDCVRFAVARVNSGPEAHGPGYFVASIHRFQNLYQESRLNIIVKEIIEIAQFGPVRFVLHPATEKRLDKTGLKETLRKNANVRIDERMPYTKFLALLAGARAVLTDGGSNQEELAYLGVPTILYRSRSERPDGLGANIVFRNQLHTSLGQYVRSGAIDDLRQPRRLDSEVQPSAICVESLRAWSTRHESARHNI